MRSAAATAPRQLRALVRRGPRRSILELRRRHPARTAHPADPGARCRSRRASSGHHQPPGRRIHALRADDQPSGRPAGVEEIDVQLPEGLAARRLCDALSRNDRRPKASCGPESLIGKSTPRSRASAATPVTAPRQSVPDRPLQRRAVRPARRDRSEGRAVRPRQVVVLSTITSTRPRQRDRHRTRSNRINAGPAKTVRSLPEL